jgi:hypothetical protein
MPVLPELLEDATMKLSGAVRLLLAQLKLELDQLTRDRMGLPRSSSLTLGSRSNVEEAHAFTRHEVQQEDQHASL